MSMDASLFGDDEPLERVPPASSQQLAAEWQVKQLRKALDAHGLDSMAGRQRLIEELLGRSLSSLSELTSAQVVALVEKLAARKTSSARDGSSWDDREGAT